MHSLLNKGDFCREPKEWHIEENDSPQSLYSNELFINGNSQGKAEANLENDLLLPDIELHELNTPARSSFENTKEYTIFGSKGRHAIVNGLELSTDESLKELITRLHPNLTDAQLEHEVNQTLKYNKDFDNDLGKGDLKAGQTIYLTSVKTYDHSGRINALRRPDGTITSFNYDKAGELYSFKSHTHSGAEIESGIKESNSRWRVNSDGISITLKNIALDLDGNLEFIESSSVSTMHLTNGIKLNIQNNSDKPEEIEAYKNDKRVFTVHYEYSGDYVKESTTFYHESENPVTLTKIFENKDFSPDFSGHDPQQRDNQNESQIKLASLASQKAAEMNSTGRCAEAVQLALAEAGMPQFLGCGHAWDMLGPLKNSGKFERVNSALVQAGDLMLRKSSSGHYGHIAIITGRSNDGQLMEASDHVSIVDRENPRYSKTVFLRFKQ